MISTDLQLDEIGDILMVNGDYVIDESDEQHIEDILDAYPGEYRQFPLLGVNLQRAVNGLIDGSLRRDINLNLQSDNYIVKKIDVTEQNLIIDAERKG